MSRSVIERATNAPDPSRIEALPMRAPDRVAPVVLLSEIFPPVIGGSGDLLENIYSRLPGVSPTVITQTRDGSTTETDCGAFRRVELQMKASEWGISDAGSVRRHVRLIRRLRLECRDRDAVVHCARALPEGFAALIFNRLWNRPFLSWTHGEELETANSSTELRILLSLVHRHASAVIGNCRTTTRRLEQMGVPSAKLHVIFPGVDVSRFSTSRNARSVRSRTTRDAKLLLLTVGRLQRRKGHDLVIQALAQLRDHGQELNYVIVGDGEERERLQQLAEALGVAGHVHFEGAVTDQDLPDYYAAADIFVHPNRVDAGDVEGFGIVFLEAAAARLPVIGGNSGGVPEAVEAGTTGLLVGGTDVSELAAAISALATSDELRQRMGAAGQARVRLQFTWERAARDLFEVHRRVSRGA